MRSEIMKEQKQLAKIRLAAMDLLTGREYSREELRIKLSKKFDDQSLIAVVIAKLVEDNLQSDKRFAEAFIRSKVNRGQGEIRIRNELSQRGISDELYLEAIENCRVDWFALAQDIALHKFGVDQPIDRSERAKRVRFLQYRGFTYDQISHVLSP